MGIHASPTCTMVYGDDGGAVGYLVGEENRGMSYMFTMMNRARLAIGAQGVGIAEAATQQAVAFAHERKQGRGAKMDATQSSRHHRTCRRQAHADDHARADQCRARDLLHDRCRDRPQRARTRTPQRAQAAHERASLLTPVAKAFSTDVATDVASLDVQVHGGMGFIEETGAAQFYRDARITQIYEGTNGIQAIDLVARKLPMSGGAAVRTYIGELRATVDAVNAANDPAFGATGVAARRGGRTAFARNRMAAGYARQGSGPRARRCHALSAAVRTGRRRLHAGRRRACRVARWRQWRGIAGPHDRDREILRHQSDDRVRRTGRRPSSKAPTASRTFPPNRSDKQIEQRPRRRHRRRRHPHNPDEPARQEKRPDAGDVRRHDGGAQRAPTAMTPSAASMFAGVPGAFSAGNDLQDFLTMAHVAGRILRARCVISCPRSSLCTKPMVAAVSGIAVGVGTTMLFHCDHVVAVERRSNSRHRSPALGLVPEAASSLLGPRVMGHARAFELLVMGRPFDRRAGEGSRIGQHDRRARRS